MTLFGASCKYQAATITSRRRPEKKRSLRRTNLQTFVSDYILGQYSSVLGDARRTLDHVDIMQLRYVIISVVTKPDFFGAIARDGFLAL